MKKGAALLLCALLAFAYARATSDDPLARAIQPLSDGLPEVAVTRLRELLAGNPPAETCARATAKLAEALIAAGRANEALEVAVDDSTNGKFVRAQALAAEGRWSEALPLYHEAAGDSTLRGEALVGEAEALRSLGQRREALQTLRLVETNPNWKKFAQLRSAAVLLDSGDVDGAARQLDQTDAKAPGERREKRFLRGRIAAARGELDRAIELFNSVLKSPEGASHSLIAATLLATADLQLKNKTPESGAHVLEEFIERHATDSDLSVLFAKLEQLYLAQRRPPRSELARWAGDPAQPRRALAQWHLSRMQARAGNTDAAIETFRQMRAARPKQAAAVPGYLEFARLLMERRQLDEAREVLADARELRQSEWMAQVDAAAGEAEYHRGGWAAAAEHFAAAGGTGAEQAGSAKYNAAIAWLQAGDAPRALASADSDIARGDVSLENALLAASRSDVKATEQLQQFLREFPDHARGAEAFVALAELAFHGSPPRTADAEKFLDSALDAHPNDIAMERADYLRIWLADAAPDPAKPGVIQRATEFLQKHTDSRFAPEVRLKLAETYNARHDFANAQTQFELLAQQQHADPSLTEKALFFAATAARQTMGPQSLDRALVLFGDVVKRSGELKWAARNAQAALERQIGKPQDALPLYDEVLKSAAPIADKREALCGKADTLCDLAGNDVEKYRAALPLYQQLAADDSAPVEWKNQALVKMAICEEKLRDRSHALETFYRVIEQETRPDRSPEFFWFYKAGFNAARLLEEEGKWESAASVYQKLAQAGGDRSEEAKSRLSALRLEHFLWEQ